MTGTMRKLLLALAFLATPAVSAPCQETRFDGARFTMCEVPFGADLRLFHSDAAGTLYGGFGSINAALAAEGKTLGFAMNAGMYHPGREPVGLFVENGQERAPIVTAGSQDNFGMRPNGVFCISDSGFAVIESRAFAANPPACRFATQSGPMLVIDGALHPRFIPGSDSTYIRNGVGVSADGQRAVFVISENRVNFDQFGRLFRDALKLPNALYFDGKISRLYAPALNRDDLGFPMGPIVGLVVAKP